MRTTQSLIILGTNGTGKSTLARELVKAACESGRRVLAVTPHLEEWHDLPLNMLATPKDFDFSGAQRHVFDDSVTLEAVQRLRNALLIFDDCRAYFNANTALRLHKILISRRQRMLDVVAIGHGFTEVPPKFFTFSTHIFLFKTLDNIATRKSVLRDFEKMKAAQMEVNRIAKEQPHFYKIIPQV